VTEEQRREIEARKQRWRDFLDMDQPPRHLFIIHYQPDDFERPWPWPDNAAERVAWAWQSYRRQLARMDWLRDDALPYLDPYTGTEIFAEALGCPVERPEDNMPFARPLVETPLDAATVRVPDWSRTRLSMLFEIADELRARAPDALMKLVDIQSPMDIAALVWEKSAFYTAMTDAPEAVKGLAAKAFELLTSFQDAWFERYGRELVAHYPAYYLPQGFTLSEDEVGVVSEAMFEEFFLPELAALSERYGGLGIHCCADARHQWANFKRVPDLRLLNLVQPPEELRDAYAFFADHCPQMHSWCGEGDPRAWVEALPDGSRAVLQATAQTRQEAVELSEALWAACGRQ
jgi:uroporphyrinogen-III decarboxylase